MLSHPKPCRSEATCDHEDIKAAYASAISLLFSCLQVETETTRFVPAAEQGGSSGGNAPESSGDSGG